MLVGGAGEGAFLVAEQDRFDQVFRDGAAIDGDEGPAGAGRGALNGAGDQFLARAAFAFDQDGNVGLRRAGAQAEHLLHFRRVGDQIVEGETVVRLLLQLLHFAGQGADLELVADRDRDAFGAGGLDQKVVGAGAHGFHGGIDAALGGQHDHRQIGIGGAQLGENFQAAHVGHHQVEQHQGDLFAAHAVDEIERGLAAGRGDDRHAAAGDRGFQQTALNRIVIHDKNCLRHNSMFRFEQAAFCAWRVNGGFKPVLVRHSRRYA